MMMTSTVQGAACAIGHGGHSSLGLALANDEPDLSLVLSLVH